MIRIQGIEVLCSNAGTNTEEYRLRIDLDNLRSYQLIIPADTSAIGCAAKLRELASTIASNALIAEETPES